MKHLFLTLTLVLGLALPNWANAQSNTIPWPASKSPVAEWTVGEMIQVVFICRDEKTVRELAEADMKSLQNIAVLSQQKLAMGDCITLPRQVPFKINDLIFQYKDHKGIDTVLLKVRLLFGSRVFEGYTIAPGVFKQSI